jgi:hypothetical protein
MFFQALNAARPDLFRQAIDNLNPGQIALM